MKLPTHFRADDGKVFEIEITKTNIKTYWVKLKGPNKTIKVKKNSKKLFRKET